MPEVTREDFILEITSHSGSKLTTVSGLTETGQVLQWAIGVAVRSGSPGNVRNNSSTNDLNLSDYFLDLSNW